MKRFFLAALAIYLTGGAFAQGGPGGPGPTPPFNGGTIANQLTTPSIVVGAPTGGSEGAGSLNAQTLFQNGTPLGTAALINTGTSGATVPLLNGVNTWSGQQNLNGGVNTTSPAGYQIGGTTILNVTSGTGGFQSVAAGPGAGLALPSNSFFATVIGNQAAPSYAVSGNGEITAIGGRACYSLVSGIYDTCVGVGALNQATGVGTITALGADSFRNSQGINDSAGVGASSGYNFMGQRTNIVGTYALYGNAASLLVGGSKTTGDVISVTFTAAGISGGAATVAYTVLAGDSIATITTAVAAAISATSAVSVAGISANTNVGITPNVIGISYHGTAAVAPTLVVTASVSGSATETVTITGGVSAAASDMNFVGYQAAYGLRMTTANKNNGFGNYVLANMVNQTTTNCMGYAACEFEQNGSAMDVIGALGFQNATGAYIVASIGFNNGNGCTTCNQVTLLGANLFTSALSNQNNIIGISDGSACNAAVSSGAFRVCLAGVTVLSGVGTGTASTGSFSFPGLVNIAGVLTLSAQPVLASSTTGAGTQTFTNSPCGALTTARWIPVTITGQSGTWNVPACQ